MAITGRLVLLAALGLALTPLSAAVPVGYAVVLLFAAAIDVTLAAPVGALTFTRDASPSLRLGGTSSTVLRLRNDGPRTLRALVRDAWVPSAGVTPRSQTVNVPPGEGRQVRSVLTPTRRGERAAVLVTVRSFGPLGIAARQRKVAVPGSVRVLPPFTSRRLLPEKLARLRAIEGAVLMKQRGQGSEFDSLREYVIGDDVRAIDWRATARAADVVVRTWRPERDRQIVLAIDTGRTSAARIGDEPRLDAAIDAALLVAAVAAKAGDRVCLVAADVAVRARTGSTAARETLPRLVEALTPLQSALVESDPQLMAAEISRSARKRALVVLFTGLDSGGGGLLAAASVLAARHQLVIAAVADPRLTELLGELENPAEVYTAAAAELAVAQRRSVAASLTRLGALVVDAPPSVFASSVADAYLDLKAAGRL
jgi:uncharacterized protein (DUF58 family)